MMSIALYLFYPLTILTIFFYFFALNNQTSELIRKHLKLLIFNVLVVFSVGNLVLFIYFRSERFIYYWDYATFWEQSLKLNEMIIQSANTAFKYVIETMNYQEYTALPALFISLPTTLLGKSFFVYVLSTYNFFVIPFLTLLLLFELILLQKLEIKIKFKSQLILINMFFIPFSFTLFHGYIGVVGQIFITTLFLIFLTKHDHLSFKEVLLISMSSFLLIFTRRWYLFWVVSYFVSYGLMIVFIHFRNVHTLSKRMMELFLSGFLLLVVIIIFFFPYFSNLLNANYTELYASYKLPSMIDEYVRFEKYYGLFVISLTLFGSFMILKSKSIHLIFIFMVTIITSILFLSVQSFEYHHYNLISFGIFTFFLIGLSKFSKNKWIAISVMALYIMNSVYVFLPKQEFFNFIFSEVELKPKFRSDITEIQDLANHLNQLTQENKYAYSAASSSFLNDDLLRNAQLPWILNSVPNLEGSSNNDVRDGFPASFFDVNYVLVTNPVQVHPGYIDKQFVNQLINNSLLFEEEIQDNYTLIYENTISGVKIYIFERITNYTDEEKMYYYNELRKVYPEHPRIYEPILKKRG